MATAISSRAGPAGGWAPPNQTARSLRPRSRPGTGITASSPAATFSRTASRLSTAGPAPARTAWRTAVVVLSRNAGAGELGAPAQAGGEGCTQRLPGAGSLFPLYQRRAGQLGGPDVVSVRTVAGTWRGSLLRGAPPAIPADEPMVPADEPGVPAYGPGVPAYGPGVPAYGPGVPAYGPGVPAYGPGVPADEVAELTLTGDGIPGRPA
jgi:hypothetical protein